MALLNILAECAPTGSVDFKDDFDVNALHELSVGMCMGDCVLYKQSLYALARVRINAFRTGADISTSKLIQDGFFPFRLIVLQSAHGALLLHSLRGNTHTPCIFYL